MMAQKPDFPAQGVNVAGVSPDGSATMTGTSAAAAITAGAAALMLQWGIVDGHNTTLNTYLVKAFLIRGCIQDPGINYPSDIWGFGRLNLMNTFLALRT
jgi:hypothetical protein